MHSSVITIVEYAYLAIICLMTAQAIFSIRLRLYIWEEPERSGMNSAPTVYLQPQLSFTILLPAYHEEGLFADTIQKVYDLNYPAHLVQILPLLRERAFRRMTISTSWSRAVSRHHRLALQSAQLQTTRPIRLQISLKLV